MPYSYISQRSGPGGRKSVELQNSMKWKNSVKITYIHGIHGFLHIFEFPRPRSENHAMHKVLKEFWEAGTANVLKFTHSYENAEFHENSVLLCKSSRI